MRLGDIYSILGEQEDIEIRDTLMNTAAPVSRKEGRDYLSAGKSQFFAFSQPIHIRRKNES